MSNPLNTLAASLVLQLCIYSTVWLVIGLGFQINRRAALWWSAGFFSIALCMAVVQMDGGGVVLGDSLLRNWFALLSFVLIRRGVEVFTERPHATMDWIGALGATVVMEVLRQLGEHTFVARVVVFTAMACWPLAAISRLILEWLRQHWSMAPWVRGLMVSPVVLTMAVLLLRAGLISSGLGTDSPDLAEGGWLDVGSMLVYFLVLGGFNFTLVSLVLGVLIQRLHELSATDKLPGLANRRVMLRRLAQEHARFLRTGQAYTVVMTDLDYFKKVNDTFGHGVGDQVLQGIAHLLQGNLRGADTLARMGGEEFMLLMPSTDADGALVQAERVRERIASAEVPTDSGPLHLTMSLGVAEVLPSDATSTPVVSRADAALYRAKAAGRNAVDVADRQKLPSQRT
ncbi:MAG: hypothetical protein CFE44_08140 [Burkholderiales bacterium PBB4]|nr:MAG: hypothetical protein CFE44_08140 [Burkholderiales bacterium PBB4]